MVRPKRKEDRTLVVRLGPGDLAHNVLTHSRETNGQRSTAELELKLGIIGEPFNSVSADEITKSDIQEWLLEQSEERDWSAAISALTVLRCRGEGVCERYVPEGYDATLVEPPFAPRLSKSRLRGSHLDVLSASRGSGARSSQDTGFEEITSGRAS